ncbi:hypothetical protein VTO42DRAFT_2292 [Malbranchea cinnamomea]
MSTPFDTPFDPVPTYEESTRGSPSASAPRSDVSKHPLGPVQRTGLPLQTELAISRTQRIDAVLSQYVDPLLSSQGAAGLYKTTFILVPSNVSELQDCPSNAFTASQDAQVVGFPEEDVVKLVRLKGQEHAMEFWRQPAVIAELESAMKARLVASGHRIYDSTQGANTDTALPSSSSESRSKKESKKSLWGRFKGRDSKDDRIEDLGLGWRAPEPQTDLPREKIPTGLVHLSIVWKDVVLRIANEMGLFESKHGPALCLTVEVGT